MCSSRPALPTQRARARARSGRSDGDVKPNRTRNFDLHHRIHFRPLRQGPSSSPLHRGDGLRDPRDSPRGHHTTSCIYHGRRPPRLRHPHPSPSPTVSETRAICTRGRHTIRLLSRPPPPTPTPLPAPPSHHATASVKSVQRNDWHLKNTHQRQAVSRVTRCGRSSVRSLVGAVVCCAARQGTTRPVSSKNPLLISRLRPSKVSSQQKCCSMLFSLR